MKRVFQLLGSRLVRLQWTFSVALQVNMHFPHSDDIATLRAVGELVAVNLVVTIVGAAIDHDVNVAEIGAAAGLELHRLGGANGVQRAASFGLGQRKSFTGLLNINTQFLGHAVQGGTHPETGKPVGNTDADNEHNNARYQRFADLSCGLKHLPSILRQPAQVSQSAGRKVAVAVCIVTTDIS